MLISTLSPPWYTFANKIKYTYGRSPYVIVGELEDYEVSGDYVLEVK